MNLCWIGIVAAWIGMIAFYVGVATGGGLPSFIERFNALSGSSYENVLNAAREGGWSIGNYVTAVTVSGGLTYVSLNTIGPTYSANIMGEIKEIRKSAILANLGCLVMYLVFWYAFYSLAYYGMSPQFWEAAAFFGPGGAGMGTSGAWTFEGAMPTANFLLVFSNSNAAFAVISSICFGICTYASAMSLSFAPIRNFFAYAFDRILPTLFARTDRRGSPYLAVLLGLCFCEFFLVVNIYTYSWIAYSITAWFFAWAIVGIFGILFAYTARGKAIFEKSPDMVRKKIGGVPIIAIWGAATFIISAYIDWFMLQPIFTGLADPLYGYMTAIIFIIPPFIIYYISRAYHKAKGVLMELQFKEIPPD
jgi:amino acid transporter